jgi:outer membrane murein-binding lipoprotein Lpp
MDRAAERGEMSEGLDELGSVVTGGLIAHAVAGRRAHHGAGEAHGACANCGTGLIGAHCHACGQSGHVHRNATGFLHDVLHGVFHFEGRTWHTLPLLAFKPGHLTRRYVDGERVKFVSPMALFLFSVFLMFAVVSNLAATGSTGSKGRLASASQEIGKQRGKIEKEIVALKAARAAAKTDAEKANLDSEIKGQATALKALGSFAGGVATAQEQAGGKTEADDKPVGIQTSIPWLDEAVRHASENPELLIYKLKSSAYKYSWALIPISLPFIWLLFAFRRDVGFYDHAIFSTYSLAFMSLLVVVLVAARAIGLPTQWLVLAFSVIPPIHMYKQLKYGYGLSRFGAAWRTFALLFITLIAATMFTALLFYLGTSH